MVSIVNSLGKIHLIYSMNLAYELYVVVLSLCKIYLEYLWDITFSFCMGVSNSLNNVFTQRIERENVPIVLTVILGIFL